MGRNLHFRNSKNLDDVSQLMAPSLVKAQNEGDGWVKAQVSWTYVCSDLPGSQSAQAWSDSTHGCMEYGKHEGWCDKYGVWDYNGNGAAKTHCCVCGGGTCKAEVSTEQQQSGMVAIFQMSALPLVLMSVQAGIKVVGKLKY